MNYPNRSFGGKKAILILCCGLAFGMTKAQQSQTFNYTGSQQTWTVPCGVSAVTLTCYGAQGGQNGNSYAGRLGGMAQGVLTVTPGETLYLYVGQNGLNGGWNGGGVGGGSWTMWGGGASDVRVGGNSLSNRVIVAGGAGSNAGYSDGYGGWNGGGGGAGGGYTGTVGINNNVGGGGGGGGGGTPSSGGALGSDYSPPSSPGSAGSLGLGGNGSGVSANSDPCESAGGGGGGYYGGGGGGFGNCGGGGGGGGSSYTGGVNSGTTTPGVQSGDGEVTLTWNASNIPLVVTGNVIDNELCNGQSDGEASGIVSGGGTPYTYLWSNFKTTDTATGLSAGTYTIGVSDACGNTASVSVSITQPTALNVSASAVSNVSCNGESNGSASSNASGGTSPYTYAWSNLQLTANATGLSAGTYTIGVSDGNGCTATASVSISQPTVLSVSASTSSNVLCNGESNGSASSNVSGGTSPYTYLWNNAESNSNATGLSAGTYTITVMDNDGCTGTASAAITQPNVLSLSDTVTANVSCNGGSNGIGASVVSGGTSPYTYLWSNLQSSPNATGLAAGTYTLGLTDANGCTATASVGITQPAAIGIISHSQADNGSGNGAAWVNVSGGTGPYTYLWNPGGNSTDSISKKDSGMYCCLVTDANGCTDSTCIKIKSTLGIGNIISGSGGIMVYPNPNNGQFTIVIASEAKQSQDVVEIYNVLGEKVYSTFNIQNPTLDINLSNQPNGIYLYRVISESGSLLGEGKIMLQK